MQYYSKDQLIEMLSTFLKESSNVRTAVNSYYGSEMSEGKFGGWRTKIVSALKNSNIDASESINVINGLSPRRTKSVEVVEEQLRALIDSIKNDYIQIIQNEEKTDPQQVLEQLFNRFHKVARQLRTRHNDRNTINISDEYDVQDLLNALLQIFFDDIRPEEWTPSYAGSAVRMDFLIKDIDTRLSDDEKYPIYYPQEERMKFKGSVEGSAIIKTTADAHIYDKGTETMEIIPVRSEV